MRGFNLFLNIMAAIIISVAALGVLFLTIQYLCNTPEIISPIKIEYQRVETDSSNTLVNVDFIRFDSIILAIEKISNDIQLNQIEILEEKGRDDFYNRLYTAFIAIVLVVAGFFGFKSITEIKTGAITSAKEAATETAKMESRKAVDEEFKRTFNEEYEAKIYEKSLAAMSSFLKDELEDIQSQLLQLEDQIGSIETRASINDAIITTSEDVSPKPAASEDVSPKLAALEDVSPKSAASEDLSSKPAASEDVSSNPSTSEDVSSKPATPEDATRKPKNPFDDAG